MALQGLAKVLQDMFWCGQGLGGFGHGLAMVLQSFAKSGPVWPRFCKVWPESLNSRIQTFQHVAPRFKVLLGLAGSGQGFAGFRKVWQGFCVVFQSLAGYGQGFAGSGRKV